MNLLLVDDDPDFRELVASCAPPWLRIRTCSSSREAVELIGAKDRVEIDLALIDVHMSPFLGELDEKEGFALARWIRSHGRDMPLVFVTAHIGDSSIDECSSLTPLGLLRKPIDLSRWFRFLEAFQALFIRRDDGSTGRPENLSRDDLGA